MDDVDELRGVGVGRQVKAVALDGDSLSGDTSALEVIVVVVPCLDMPGFRPNVVARFPSLELVELTLILFALLLGLLSCC